MKTPRSEKALEIAEARMKRLKTLYVNNGGKNRRDSFIRAKMEVERLRASKC